MPNDTAKILVQNRAIRRKRSRPVSHAVTCERGDIGRQPDGEAWKDDVERDGEGELQPRQQDGIEIHGFSPQQRLRHARSRHPNQHVGPAVEFRKRAAVPASRRRYAGGWVGPFSIGGIDHERHGIAGPSGFLERYFRLKENGTDVRTEFIAGATTFLTMVYIVFVNPQILGKAGMDKGAVFVATCIAAAVSTLVMALYANYPIALAPGMGLNAFFAFTVVLGYKYTWQQALGRRVLLGRALLPDLDLPHPRIRHQRHPEEPEARDLRGRRPVPPHHRAGGSQDRGRASGDAGHARRSQAVAGGPVPPRLRADRGAELPQGHRRHRDRHPGRFA